MHAIFNSPDRRLDAHSYTSRAAVKSPVKIKQR
jgi:hypothetical protein